MYDKNESSIHEIMKKEKICAILTFITGIYGIQCLLLSAISGIRWGARKLSLMDTGVLLYTCQSLQKRTQKLHNIRRSLPCSFSKRPHSFHRFGPRRVV